MTDTTANATHFEAHGAHAAHHDDDHKPGFFARWFMSTNRTLGKLPWIAPTLGTACPSLPPEGAVPPWGGPAVELSPVPNDWVVPPMRSFMVRRW